MELGSKRFADAAVALPGGAHRSRDGRWIQGRARSVPRSLHGGGDRVVLDLSTRRLRGPGPERRVDAMGLFRVRGHLAGPTGRSEDVDLLVDTGRHSSSFREPLATRLELVTRRSQPVLIAGGQRAIWPVAEATLTLEGLDAHHTLLHRARGTGTPGCRCARKSLPGCRPRRKAFDPRGGDGRLAQLPQFEGVEGRSFAALTAKVATTFARRWRCGGGIAKPLREVEAEAVEERSLGPIRARTQRRRSSRPSLVGRTTSVL